MVSVIRSRQFYVNIFLFLVLLFFSYLLCSDFKKRISVGNREPIGEIISQLKDTKRKLHAEVVWEPIDVNFPVYDKDTIRTDEYSEITVKLKDGTEVKLEENSMAVFSLSEEELNIHFSNGALELNNAKHVKLISNENKFLIENGKLKARKGYTNLVNIKVEEGNVQLKSQDKLETIEKNSNVKVKEERILLSEKTPSLIMPVSNYFSTDKEKLVIPFEWQPVSPNSKYRLEISNAKNKALVFQKEVSGNQIEVSLPVGNYRWKLVPSSKEEIASEYAKFAVVSSKPIQILLPTLSAKFTYVNYPPKVLFRWTKEEFFKRYKLEISTSPNFSDLVASYDTLSDEILVEKLGTGKYYYRIIAMPISSQMQPKQSLVMDFEIQQVIKPEAIQIISPENEKQVFLLKKNDSEISFVWKKNKEYSNYEFQISKTSDFKDLIHQEMTKEHFLILKKNIPSGSYFWRVLGHFGNEKISSETRSIHIGDVSRITLLKPQNQEMIEEGIIEFHWKDFPSIKSYSFEISEDNNFQKIILTQTVQSNSVSITLRNKGKFYWRVRAPENPKIFSEIREFILIPEPKIEILYPMDKETIDVYPLQELKFSWKSNVGLQSYELEILKLPERTKILLVKNWKKNEYIVKNLKIFKRSAYELKVSSDYQAKNSDEVRKLTKKVNFTITLSKVSTKEDIHFLTPNEIYVE